METRDQRTLKGDATRARLLSEAMRLFAERGYEGVSTRELAAAAESNVALITFHFGSKRGLYEATLDDMLVRLAKVIVPVVDSLHGALVTHRHTAEHNPRAFFCALRDIIHQLLLRFLPATPTPGFFQLLSREMQEQGKHSAKLWQIMLPLRTGLEDALNLAAKPDQRDSHDLRTRSRIAAFLLIDAILAIMRDYSVFRPHFNEDESEGNQEDDASTLADLLCAGLAAALERRTPCRQE